MSANNYMLIQKVGDQYYAWDNLNAEEAMGEQPLTTSEADFTSSSLEEMVAWANENDRTEYGYQINDPYKPKDGFPEVILTEETITTKIIEDKVDQEIVYRLQALVDGEIVFESDYADTAQLEKGLTAAELAVEGEISDGE